jgi:spore coat polysaccharide biosynthesis protein SpsF (cytidylyltransferase family)
MRVIAIIQARLGSKRLPGKVLMEIEGRPLLAHVVERALAIQGVDRIVVNAPDRDVCELREATPAEAEVYGIKDQEQDVLGSYLEVARTEHADVIMRLTGDCPLLDPELCASVLELHRGLPSAYAANDTLRSGYPDGTDCEVFSMQALNLAAYTASDPFEREHVCVWMRRHMPCYTIVAPWGTDLTGAKWSVDTTDDLRAVRAIYSQLEPGQYGWRATAKAWRSMT